MSGEWFGCRAAVNGLQDWGFNFQEIVRIQEFAQSPDHGRPFTEGFAHVRVDCQVGIALTGAQFRIFERGVADRFAVLHQLILGSRERADGLGQQFEICDVQRHLARTGAEHAARGLDEITDIEHLVEEIQPLLSHVIHPEK